LFVELAANTGGRWGELAGLHRERINVQQLRIVIQEVADEGGVIKPYPKSRHRRGIPITPEFAARLEQWMRDHPPIPCRAKHRGGKPCGGHLLFATRQGTAWEYHNFRRELWDPMVQAAGLPDVTPHDLRHTYASWLVQNGVKTEQIQALLGHQFIGTTQRYAHLADSQWDTVRDVLRGVTATPAAPVPAASSPAPLSADDLAAAIAQMAEQDPRWGAVAAALTRPTTPDPAGSVPHLSHDGKDTGGTKIIHLDRFHRSAG